MLSRNVFRIALVSSCYLAFGCSDDTVGDHDHDTAPDHSHSGNAAADHTHDYSANFAGTAHTHSGYSAADHTHTVAVTNAMISSAGTWGVAPCVTGATKCELVSGVSQLSTCVDGAWGAAAACPNAASGDECWHVWLQNGWNGVCTAGCKTAEAGSPAIGSAAAIPAKRINHGGKWRVCTDHYHKPYLWNSVHYSAPTDCGAGSPVYGTTGQTCKDAGGAVADEGEECTCQN